ncbi:MAG: SUMF1/EgtB/PvdO family nonheme iron enzyme, partial [Chloroflexi bacterium]|nr:SUMF1/EgtB/PvdO family nonheme iron enzyme [Chloroflexota bacterium]
VAFFVPLNSYRRPDANAALPDPYDWLAEEWHIRQPRLSDFKSLYENGNILLLLDGLNEMPHRDKADYRTRIGRWRTFWQRTAQYGNTVVFSCRSLDYSSPLSGETAVVRQTQVEPLTPAQIEQFLHLHLPQKGEDVWQALRHDSQRLALFNAPFFLRLLVDQIAATGIMPDGQAALLTNFVRRSLYREVERQDRLFAPGSLLSEDDYQQTVSNLWADPFDLPNEGDLIPSLERLAYQMQAGRLAEEAGLVRAKTTEVQTWLDHSAAKEMIAAGCQLNLLDKDLARREITFFHQLIQEFFAARILARKPEPDRLTVPWHTDTAAESLADTVARLEISDPLPKLPATGWEETTLMAAAMNKNQEAFVSDLIEPNLPLAARCAAAAEVTVSAKLKRRLQEALIARCNDPQADLRARIAAAEALGDLGDPRFARRTGPHGDYLLPPLAQIPKDSYPIGDDKSQYSDEKPAHTVPIAAFKLALFPLTNAEYGLFMAAGGYEDEQWWQTEAARAWLRGEGSSEGQKANFRDIYQQLQGRSVESIRQLQATPDQIDAWLEVKEWSEQALEKQLEEWFPGGEKYRQPAYWEDSQFNHPSQPVVGITWFEARAYCAWLSSQTGDVYGLPTEVEWEAAARGKKGRTYAWGKQFDTANCNTFETHIRATTPIGVFPKGRSPEKVADLSGNVWEWASTIWGEKLQKPDFPYPYDAQDGRENLDDASSRRVLRGGSWSSSQGSARAAYRNYYLPNDRYNDVGVRLVVRRSPSQ